MSDRSSRSVRDVLMSLDAEFASVIRRMDSRVSPKHSELLVDWMGELRIARGLSYRTLIRYLKHSIDFVVWMAEEGLEIETVQYADLERWARDLFLRRNLAARTRMVAVVSVRRLYAWLEQTTGRMSPARHLPMPKIDRRVPRRYSAKELAMMLASCDTATVRGCRDYALLLLFYATGARREEMEALSLSALEMHQRTATWRILGKGMKERMISFEGPAVTALQNWLAVRESLKVRDKDAVWLSVGRAAGSRLSYRGLEAVVKDAARKSGIVDWGVHRFRVTFASDLYDSGVDINTIQRLMGHEDMRTTQGYLAVSDKRQSARMPARLQAKIAGKQGSGLPLWAQEKLKKGGQL